MDVGDWLRGLGLGQYEAVFRENEIDAKVLTKLTTDDLKDLGVTIIGHRRTILSAIEGLSTAPPPRIAPPSEMITPTTADESAERRQLTVMFCDLVGSTAMSARLDPEDMRGVVAAYHKCCASRITSNGGFVAKYMGDGVLAYFGYPQAHEHDAERAVRSGLAIVEAAPKIETSVGMPLHVRVGIATGTVVVGDLLGSGEAHERGVVGNTPNLAARLQSIAAPDSVVIADGTRRLLGNLFEVSPLGPQELKGIAGWTRAFVALRESSQESRFEALHASGVSELVGREEETDLLLRRWKKAAAGEGQVVLLSGEAGIGKSRLMAEILERLAGEPHVRLRYFCSPQHTDGALYPIIAQLERAAGLSREDAPRTKLDKLDALLATTSTPREEAALLAEMLSLANDGRHQIGDLSPQRRRQKTLEALNSQIAVISRMTPALIVFEDVHWADPSSLEVIGRLVDGIDSLPALLFVTFRPEFAAPWVGRSHVTALTLNRLTVREGAALIDRVAGNKPLSANIRRDIVERADGIALFIEEMTKAVLETEGEEQAEKTVAAVPSPAFAVPASLYASLMARLDRLGSAKSIAQLGAAIGREFSHAVLAPVSELPEAELAAALDRLLQSGLVSRQGEPPYASYLFKHALVQDAAYSTLLREPRRALHARIARVLEGQFPEIGESQPEKLSHHCIEAGQIEKAVEYALAAARRAATRSAMEEAVSQARKGIELVSRLRDGPTRHAQELELQVILGDSLQATRGYSAPEAGEAHVRARELCVQLGEPQRLVSVIWGLWEFRQHRLELEVAEKLAAEMRQLGEAEGDGSVTFLSCHMSGFNRSYLGDYSRSRDYFEEGLRNPSCVMGGFHPRVGSLMSVARMLLYLGHLDQARARYEQGLEEARKSNPFTLATALVLAIMWQRPYGGDISALAEELLKLSEEQGFRPLCVFASFSRGWMLAMKGALDEGIAEITNNLQTTQTSLITFLGPLFLAEAYGRAGQPEIGLKCLAEVEDAPQLRVFVGGLAEIGLVRARLLIQSSDSVAAEECLLRAIAVAKEQNAKFLELLVTIDLAQLWAERRSGVDAARLLRPIHGWFTEGFQSPALQSATALLDKLGGPPEPRVDYRDQRTILST
jgi:class 3 adenylate cyclase/tetratricopeptide (TPR) repeat protein